MSTIEATNTMNRPLPNQQPRNRLLVWSRRVLLSLLVTPVVLAVIGAIYQVIGTALDARAFPPPGQLVDVGGYKMHIVCTGPQKAGAPTVILDDVGVGNAAQWGLVQPEIAKTTHVCAYDRAGFGWSERGPTPHDARQSMQELHTLLGKAGVPAPYILVGHSYGGNVARLYVAEYPAEVVGMVLVDPGIQFDTPGVPADMNANLESRGSDHHASCPLSLSTGGIMRLGSALGATPGHGDIPAASGAAYDAVNLTTKFWDTLAIKTRRWRPHQKKCWGHPKPGRAAIDCVERVAACR